jgi:hypothetical protein
MIQIPKNRILENQYTNGTGIGKNIALRFTKSKIPYIGFYNVINGTKYFTGKLYTETSKPLEKYNILATAAKVVAAAGSVATQANSLLGPKASTVRYFYKDLTSKDVIIKEIDKDAYNKLQSSASLSYQVISFNPKTQTLDEVNKQMPGLREFLVT